MDEVWQLYAEYPDYDDVVKVEIRKKEERSFPKMYDTGR